MDTIYKLDNYHKGLPAYFHVLENCGISEGIKRNEIWETHLHEVFEKYVNKDSVVIECGCHIGTHTIKLAKMCNKIYAFEPMPNTNKILNMNINLNKISNAFVSRLGVSSEPGKTKFLWIADGNPGCSGLDNNPMGKPSYIQNCENTIDVYLTSIDCLNLDKVDFIKIDVEGYETLVIKGAMTTINKCKPIIVIEVWANHFGGVDLEHTKNIFKQLLDIGYTVSHISGPDFLFIPK